MADQNVSDLGLAWGFANTLDQEVVENISSSWAVANILNLLEAAENLPRVDCRDTESSQGSHGVRSDRVAAIDPGTNPCQPGVAGQGPEKAANFSKLDSLTPNSRKGWSYALPGDCCGFHSP